MKAWLSRFWEGLKTWCFKYIGGLFMEDKAGQMVVSLGRVAILLVLLQMMWIWKRAVVDGEQISALPEGMIEVFLILASYVFGTKAVNALNKKWTK